MAISLHRWTGAPLTITPTNIATNCSGITNNYVYTTSKISNNISTSVNAPTSYTLSASSYTSKFILDTACTGGTQLTTYWKYKNGGESNKITDIYVYTYTAATSLTVTPAGGTSVWSDATINRNITTKPANGSRTTVTSKYKLTCLNADTNFVTYYSSVAYMSVTDCQFNTAFALTTAYLPELPKLMSYYGQAASTFILKYKAETLPGVSHNGDSEYDAAAPGYVAGTLISGSTNITVKNAVTALNSNISSKTITTSSGTNTVTITYSFNTSGGASTNGYKPYVTTVTAASSSTSVATVSGTTSFTVTGKSVGTSTITLTCANCCSTGNKTKTVAIKVINAFSSQSVEIGSTLTWNVGVSDFAYSTSTSNVTLVKDGTNLKITGAAAGTAVVKIDNTISATITAIKAFSSLTLNTGDSNTVDTGLTSCTASSSKTSVATVSVSGGKVTVNAVSPGTANLIVNNVTMGTITVKDLTVSIS